MRFPGRSGHGCNSVRHEICAVSTARVHETRRHDRERARSPDARSLRKPNRVSDGTCRQRDKTAATVTRASELKESEHAAGVISDEEECRLTTCTYVGSAEPDGRRLALQLRA